MPKLNVSLPPDVAEFVDTEIASGDYANASDVVSDALRLLRQERDAEAAKLALLRDAIAEGVADARAGRTAEPSLDELVGAVLSEDRG